MHIRKNGAGLLARIGRPALLASAAMGALVAPAAHAVVPNDGKTPTQILDTGVNGVATGINQGLTWSMTQTAKLDLTRADQRGLVIGLNEFSVSAGSVLRTRKIISEWTKEEADALTEKVMKLETSNEVRAMLQAAIK